MSSEPKSRPGVLFNRRTPEREAALMRQVIQNPEKKFLYAKFCTRTGARLSIGRYRKHRQPHGFRVVFTAEERDDGDGFLSFAYVQFDRRS